MAALRQAAVGPPAQTPLARAAQLSVQLLLVAGALALLAFALLHLLLVILPVLVATFLATILLPVADFLRRRGLPDALSALLVVAAAVSLLGGLTAFLAPQLVDEFDNVGEQVELGLRQLGSTLESLGLSQTEINQAIENGLDTLRENSGGIGRSIVSGAILVFEVLAGLLLTVVVLFFLLKDGRGIWAWFVGLLPIGRRDDARELGRRSWTTLAGYLRGVAFVALFDATAIAVALAILGVPLVPPLAALTFFSAFFPLIGAVTAGFVAALVALVSNGPVTALIVVAVIIVVQQVEGNVIYPVIVGHQIRLHPLAILLSVTAGAVVAGVVGALFAVPLAAVLWSSVQYLRGDPTAPEPEPVGG
ncbi:MAG TPA: AI-2E family transporter, partial [Thermoleophilaceae bacterium]|nr:AI-2E family transporter [Thermoleophilaceae bacterium]